MSESADAAPATIVERFTVAMREVVADRGPNYVYPRGEAGWVEAEDPQEFSAGCRYVRADVEEPACLIGVALFKLGVTLDQLREAEGQTGGAVVFHFFPDAPLVLLVAIDRAQSYQDEGKTWGEALEAYEDTLRSHGLLSA
jgi:hypothetical protein